MKNRTVLPLLLVFSASAAAGQDLPVVLQQELGNRQGSPQAFYSMQEFANCVEKHFRPSVADYLATDFSSSPEEKTIAGSKLLQHIDACYTTVYLKADAAFFRGALIQAAYNDLTKGGTAIHLGAPDPAPMGQSIALAHCVVDRRLDAAKKLVSTLIASRQESAVRESMQPDLNDCAIKAGVHTIYPQLFRYQVVEELYRRATDQALATAESVSSSAKGRSQ